MYKLLVRKDEVLLIKVVSYLKSLRDWVVTSYVLKTFDIL